MSCTVNSLLIPIQLCGGKKTKHPRYNNVSRVFLFFSLAFNTIPHYESFALWRILIEPEKKCVFTFCFYKKMKKKCCATHFDEICAGCWKVHPTGVSDTFRQFEVGCDWKNFLIFYRNICYNIPNFCNWPKTGMLNRPLKTASFQRLYFTFNFKIWNVAYMLHFYFLQKKSTTTLLAVLSKHDYYS